MFGKNEIVGKKYFKGADPNTLTVTSRFFTLQGEGPFRGEPAVFLRLAKCNLACSFCDTYFDSGDVYTFDEIKTQLFAVIDKFYADRNMPLPSKEWVKKNVVLVVTGGEPSIQSNLTAFLNECGDLFGRTQIESNGIAYLPVPQHTTYVVSPKCLEKDGKPVRYLKPNDDTLSRADCLKFVMSTPQPTTGIVTLACTEPNPYSEVPEWAIKWREETGKPIFVSPMNIYNDEPQRAKDMRADKQTEIDIATRSDVDEVISFWEEGLLDMKANQANHEYTAEYAMKYGFILNLQIHLYASLA